jgi:hypothetical protein
MIKDFEALTDFDSDQTARRLIWGFSVEEFPLHIVKLIVQQDYTIFQLKERVRALEAKLESVAR